MPKEVPAKKTAAAGSKKLTPYNKYMKTELANVKKEKPELKHQEAFKIVAQRWRSSPENPKNKK